MINKILLASCFFLCSNLVADESSSNIIKTNDPDVYLKNVQCDDTQPRINFNLVNKSDTQVYEIKMVLIDSGGDPIAQEKITLKYGNYINPQTGYAGSFRLKNCKTLEQTHKLNFIVSKTRYSY